MTDLSRGDPIEVRKATHDGYIWIPAVVVSVEEHAIGVAYASGMRHVLERGKQHYRRPQRA